MLDLFQDSRLIKVFKTGFSSLIIKIISVAISFISVPLTLNYLGKEQYGVWLTITSVFALITFADLGLGNSLTNSIAKASANQSILEARVQISNTFYTLLSISFSLIFLIVFCSASFDLSFIFKVQSEALNSQTQKAIYVVALMFILNLPLGVVQRIFEGYQKGYIFQYFLLLGNLVGFILLFSFIYFKLQLPYLSFALLSSTFVANLISGAYLFFFYNIGIKPSWSLIDKKIAVRNFKIGFVFFLLQIFSFLNLSSDNFIIMKFSEVKNVPEFDIVKKLFTVSFLLVYFIIPLWPAFSDAILKKDFDWAKRIFFKSIVFSISLTALISGLILILSPYILALWVGPTIKPSWNLLISFYLFTIIANFGGIVGALFNSEELLKRQLLNVGIATFVTMVLKILFINYLGIDFLIWANVIGFGIFFIYPSTRLANDILSEKIFVKSNAPKEN